MTARELRDQLVFISGKLGELGTRLDQLKVESQSDQSSAAMMVVRNALDEASMLYKTAASVLSSATAAVAIEATAVSRKQSRGSSTTR